MRGPRRTWLGPSVGVGLLVPLAHIKATFVFDSPGSLSGVAPNAVWAALKHPWYLHLDVLAYAPPLAPIVNPLLAGLDQLLAVEFDVWKLHEPGSNALGIFKLMRICFGLADGVMQLVAEYPAAPLHRQSAIDDLLTDVTSFASVADEQTLRDAVDPYAPVGQQIAPLPGVGVRPSVAGFTAAQADTVNQALDWIAANFPLTFADRQVTISPLPPNPQTTGHTSDWTGDVSVALKSDGSPNAVADLVDTLVHELMHAKTDLLGRLEQGFRIGIMNDTTEHEFLDAAGVAARAQFLGFPNVIDKKLIFDEANAFVPFLMNRDGTVYLRLPWGAVARAFFADFMRIRTGPQPDH